MDLPQPPPDQELRNIIDKLAQFVARNGPEFEQMTKTKQKDNPKFGFLFGGEHYHYYTYKVNTEQAILRNRPPPSQPPPQQQQQPPYYDNSGYGPPGGGDGPPGGGYWNQGPPPGPPPSRHGGWDAPPRDAGPPPSRSGPRPLMEIPTPYASQQSQPNTGPSVEELRDKMKPLSQQQQTLRDQIEQSESNLKAQYDVIVKQQEGLKVAAIKKARWEHLEQLAGDTQVDLEEMETVMHPIIESCTKDSIGSGKGWIFQKAVSHDNNQLIAHYLAYRVTQEDANFTLKLHLIYLMNDVLHHCVRKNAEELKESLESVAVEMFCAASVSAAAEQKPKLEKLIKLWDDKRIFSSSTLNKMRSAEASWQAYKDGLEEDYSRTVSDATRPSQQQYESYKQQHQTFVNHAAATIKNLETQKIAIQEQIDEAEERERRAEEAKQAPPPQRQQQQQHQQQQQPPPNWHQPPSQGPPPSDENGSGNGAQGEMSSAPPPSKPRTGRSSRWDTGGTKASEQQQNLQPPQVWAPNPSQGVLPGAFGAPPNPAMGGAPPGMPPGGPPPMGYNGAQGPPMGGPPQGGYENPMGQAPALPDLSRPPPGFAPQIDERSLIPTLPYHDLPAGLMVPLVKLEDSGYKPLDPKKIRLPAPTPPTERLLQALELFYAPPSHERPRDPEGWEMIGLYEWQRDKSEAVAKKAKEIESGERERSPTQSPEPYGSSTPDKTPPYRKEEEEKNGKQKKKRYEEEKSEEAEERSRKRYRSRSRSRTRSRSRGSTPEHRRRRSLSRSPSPNGSYSMPSYLTKRSPSPEHTRRDNSPRRRRRSPTPEAYVGFGGASGSRGSNERLDSSNKGHQMLQKMGWKGSGLGTAESGIVDPISGGEVRDKQDQYKGVGVGSDPFEAFRKAKSGSFYTRMKERGDSRK